MPVTLAGLRLSGMALGRKYFTSFQRLRTLQGQQVSLEARYLVVRQLHVLQRSGVPLLSSLQALERQVPPGVLRRMLHQIGQDILAGSTLSQAFSRYPKPFSPVFIGMIRVGETSGLLAEVLQRLAELYAWEIELRAKIVQALQYPLVVIMMLCGAMTVMVTFVLPRFTTFFASLNIPLPIQTRALIGLSWLVTHYGWLLLLVIVGMVSLWGWYIRTPAGRWWWDKTLLRLPVLGTVIEQLAMTGLARMLAALYGTGVPMLEALALAGETVDNKHVQRELGNVSQRVKGGESLSSAFRTNGLFPPIVVQMVSTGEETGLMDELLRSVAEYYDQQATYRLRQFLAYVEPAMIVVVGAGVLMMATAVLIPMWDLVKIVQQTGG